MSKKQTLDDAYAAPANYLEIDVINPITHGIGNQRYTDYEVRMKTNLPVFRVKESSVRRRYSDFEWLRNELERDSKVITDHVLLKIISLLCRLLFLLCLAKQSSDSFHLGMMMEYLRRISLRTGD